MRHAIRIAVTIGVAAGALLTMAGIRLHAQAADPNAAPNPYRMEENWAKLPDNRKWGEAIAVEVDHSDGKSIWVFDRCGAKECTASTVAPLQKFDSSGKFVRAIGAGLFTVSHGLYVDRDGNVWASDQMAQNGKGAIVVKFSPDGKVLMTLGKPGMPGNDQDHLSGASDVVVASNGDIYVADGHGAGTNDRIVKFSKDGKFITAWGKHGKGPGEFDVPHGIALDSAGRVFVGDRSNSRVQIFDPDGKFLTEWKQFGRPSSVSIDKNDMIYVADTQSTPANNPGFKQSIRVASLKDGEVTAFIPEASAEVGNPEGITVDDQGTIYGGFVGKMNLRRYVKQ